MQTPLTKLLNIKYPILQAPIGSATTPQLAAAVSNSGGLGMLALSWKDADETRKAIRTTKSLTKYSFAVNLVLAFEQDERVKICIEEKVPIVSFFWGDPSKFIDVLHRNNILICQTVASSADAMVYEQRGIDFLIAQGWEAGGHILGSTATSVLVPAIVDKVKIPVAAAGGIADGRGILANLCLGASGVCLGTRFLMSNEAAVSSIYTQKIIEAHENSTTYAARLFNIGWDYAPHRILKNSTVDLWKIAGEPEEGKRPKENEIIAYKEKGEPVLRYSDAIPLSTMSGNLEALALYAGQSAGLITEVKPAAYIVSELIDQLKLELKRLHKLSTEYN